MQKVQPGQALKIPAATFNNFVDAAQDFQRRRLDQSVTEDKGRGRVYIKNNSGDSIEPHNVLGIDGSIYADDESAFLSGYAFDGVSPVLPDHLDRWAVVANGGAAGEVLECVVSGLTIAKVNVVDIEHRFADIHAETGGGAPSPTILQSAPVGRARIIHGPSVAGEALCVIVVDSDAPYVYEATADEDEGEITAKLIDSTGAVVGAEITFLVLPDSP